MSIFSTPIGRRPSFSPVSSSSLPSLLHTQPLLGQSLADVLAHLRLLGVFDQGHVVKHLRKEDSHELVSTIFTYTRPLNIYTACPEYMQVPTCTGAWNSWAKNQGWTLKSFTYIRVTYRHACTCQP